MRNVLQSPGRWKPLRGERRQIRSRSLRREGEEPVNTIRDLLATRITEQGGAARQYWTSSPLQLWEGWCRLRKTQGVWRQSGGGRSGGRGKRSGGRRVRGFCGTGGTEGSTDGGSPFLCLLLSAISFVLSAVRFIILGKSLGGAKGSLQRAVFARTAGGEG